MTTSPLGSTTTAVTNVPSPQPTSPPIPVLLLKTPSKPIDAYKTYLTTPYTAPTFVPVLAHTFLSPALAQLSSLIPHPLSTLYSGLIFTSQRAVEAFASVIHTLTTPSKANTNCAINKEALHKLALPLYTVGPATYRALEALRSEFFPLCTVLGQETGNGEGLAHYILTHHPRALATSTDSSTYYSSPTLPLLFLVGEQRRDIIPKTLTNPSVPASERLGVEEIPVYTTTTLPTFASSFASILEETAACPVRWVVVFSPTGCEALLKTLGWLEEGTGKVVKSKKEGAGKGKRNVLVAAIGPTTREYLAREYGLEVDVCAERPSPEGVREGIEGVMKARRLIQERDSS